MEDQQSENIPFDDQCDSSIRISLLHICYFIALFDFAQSIYFLAQSTSLLALDVNLYSMVAFVGSIFWIIMVILLIVGLWKRRLQLIICWLIFSIIGIIVDIFFFVWTISISEYVQWAQIIQFTLLYFGIVVEWLCIYIVYRYCLNIVSLSDYSEKEDQPDNDRPIEMAPTDQQKASSRNSTKLKPKKKPGKIIIVENSSNRSRGFELLEQSDKKDETNGGTPKSLRDSLEKESYKDKRMKH